jgi:hypothetical protein
LKLLHNVLFLNQNKKNTRKSMAAGSKMENVSLKEEAALNGLREMGLRDDIVDTILSDLHKWRNPYLTFVGDVAASLSEVVSGDEEEGDAVIEDEADVFVRGSTLWNWYNTNLKTPIRHVNAMGIVANALRTLYSSRDRNKLCCAEGETVKVAIASSPYTDGVEPFDVPYSVLTGETVEPIFTEGWCTRAGFDISDFLHTHIGAFDDGTLLFHGTSHSQFMTTVNTGCLFYKRAGSEVWGGAGWGYHVTQSFQVAVAAACGHVHSDDDYVAILIFRINKTIQDAIDTSFTFSTATEDERLRWERAVARNNEVWDYKDRYPFTYTVDDIPEMDRAEVAEMIIAPIVRNPTVSLDPFTFDDGTVPLEYIVQQHDTRVALLQCLEHVLVIKRSHVLC